MNRKRDVLAILIILSQTLVAIVMISVIEVSTNIKVIKTWLPYWKVLILALALLSIASIKNVFIHARESIMSKVTKEHLRQLEALMVTLQADKHEFRRHLQALQSLIYINRINEAKKYIDGIAEKYWNTHNEIFINHPALSTLTNSKLSMAESQGIEFAVTATCDFTLLKVEPWDICTIVGNLLDNAMESAFQDKVKPWVEIVFEYQDSMYIFCVRNNGARINQNDQKKIFDAGYTSKDSKGRGYGLFIVKNLVDHYGGEIEVYSDKQTTIMVRLPGGEKCA